MRTINVHEAKTHLSRILEEIAAGDEVILAKAGKPMAVLSPYHQQSKKRRFFQMEGSIEIPDDFTETPSDFRTAFE
jgi:prevent-host-death family protein